MTKAQKRKFLNAMTEAEFAAYMAKKRAKRVGKTAEQLRREYTEQEIRIRTNEQVRQAEVDVPLFNDPRQ
jgi:signal-transduction protein with cAMP-binding, CBS, and nucleotidyltransferase domain